MKSSTNSCIQTLLQTAGGWGPLCWHKLPTLQHVFGRLPFATYACIFVFYILRHSTYTGISVNIISLCSPILFINSESHQHHQHHPAATSPACAAVQPCSSCKTSSAGNYPHYPNTSPPHATWFAPGCQPPWTPRKHMNWLGQWCCMGQGTWQVNMTSDFPYLTSPHAFTCWGSSSCKSVRISQFRNHWPLDDRKYATSLLQHAAATTYSSLPMQDIHCLLSFWIDLKCALVHCKGTRKIFCEGTPWF